MTPDEISEFNEPADLLKFYARRMVGTDDPRELVLFLMAEFRVDRRTARAIGGGDALFLLDMLNLWRTEPPETRHHVLKSVAEFRGWRQKHLDDPDITDEVRGQAEAFIEASGRGGLWLKGGKIKQRPDISRGTQQELTKRLGFKSHSYKKALTDAQGKGDILMKPVGRGKRVLWDMWILRPEKYPAPTD